MGLLDFFKLKYFYLKIMKKFWLNKKWRLTFISAIAFRLVLLPLTVLAKQMGDGSVLPFPSVPSASVAASTLP
jgi:hypothetical protein